MILICDTYSMLYRAFHALPPLTTSRGEPTGALFGFMSLLVKLLREQRPEGLAFALDGPRPSFRKEPGFFDATRYASKRESFDDQVRQIIELLHRHPELRDVVTEIDTVGDERGFYRKAHFQEMRVGMRKLQAYGFRTRSHHGETGSPRRFARRMRWSMEWK